MKLSFLKKYQSSFLNYRVVLVMDILLSVFASLITSLSSLTLFGRPDVSLHLVLYYVLIALGATLLAELLTRTYRYTIRHMDLSDLFHYGAGAAIKIIIIALILFYFGYHSFRLLFFLIFDFLATLFCFIGCRVFMILVFRAYTEDTNKKHTTDNILVFGVRTKAASLVTRLSNSETYNIIGFISPKHSDNGNVLCDKPIYYFDTYQDFLGFAKERKVTAVLFAHEKEARSEADGFVRYCYLNGIKVLIAPSVDEVVGGKVMQGKVRELKIEDLLGREEIELNLEEIRKDFSGKVVLVTGAAGSIGSELVRQLAGFDVKKLVLFDNAETPMHNLRLELEEKFTKLDFVPVIGDIRELNRLDYVFNTYKPQVVFHAAAYKHVPLMEENPREAVLVNVVGSRNIADKCIEYGVEKMVMISTDKAVNPTNVMGCTKRLAELYVQSLGIAVEKGSVKGTTKFVTTRFGNVLGSNGSVIPRFREQIEKGGPVTVTHPEINRFFMTIPEACRLVMEAAVLPYSNRIYAFDMGSPVKIDTLARKMIELAGFRPEVDIKIVYTGLRPGEKLYEEVLASDENTEKTAHDRIRIACVREFEYEEVRENSIELEKYSRTCPDVSALKELMRKLVPEFKTESVA